MARTCRSTVEQLRTYRIRQQVTLDRAIAFRPDTREAALKHKWRIGRPAIVVIDDNANRAHFALLADLTSVVRELVIDGSNLSMLAEAIKQSSIRTAVFFPYQEMGPADAILLAAAIEQSRCVTSLDLDDNEIDDVGATALARPSNRAAA